MRIALHFLLFMFFYVHSIGQITLSVQTTPSTCQNNGSITVTATGGSGSYNYTLTSSTAGISLPQATGNIFYGLPSGNYTVEVTDNNGNINTMNATVAGNYTNPVISTVESAPSYGNMVYGTTLVNVQNGTGTPPFLYAYSPVGSPAPNSTAYQSSNLIGCIPTGSHNIYVKDACGNVNVYTTYVEGANMNFSISCNLAPVGNNIILSIDYYNSIYDGQEPFTYQIGATSLSGTLPATGNTAIQFTPTCATDSITVTNGCGQSQTHAINCLIGNITCAKFSNGTSSLNADGGVSPYTYSYQMPSGAWLTNSTGNFTGLPVGASLYHFKVTDACGNVNNNYNASCDISRIFNLSPDNVYFNQNCGNLTSMGYYLNSCSYDYERLPITYKCTTCSPQISKTSTASSSSVNFTPNNITGTQTFLITDACGNQINKNFVPTPPSTDISIYVTCSSANLTLYRPNCSPSIPSTPTTYTIMLPLGTVSNTTGIFTGLTPGTYTVTATNSCCATTQTTVIIPAPGTSISIDDVTCSSAKLTLYRSGCSSGIPSSPTTYTIMLPSGAVSNTTGIFTGLTPGTYTATATNSCCVITQTTVTIPAPTPFVAPPWVLYPSSTIVNGVCVRSWYLFFPTYDSYKLSGGSNNQNYGTSYYFNNLQPGTYKVSKPCFSGSQTIILPPLPPANLTGTVTAGCQGLTGTITLQGATNWAAWGATHGVTISGYDSYNYSTNSIYPNLLTGTTHSYALIPYYGSCAVSTLSLTIPDYVPVEINPLMGATCSSSSTASVGATTQYGVAPFTYTLLDSNQNILSTQVINSNSVVFNNRPNGDYTIRVTDACGTIRNTEVNVNSLNFTPTFKRYCDSTIFLSASNIANATYSWAYNGTPIANANNVNLTLNTINSGNYTVYVTVGVCTYNNSVTIPTFNGQTLASNAGTDSSLCSDIVGSSTINLWANNIPSGVTGYWQQISGTGNSIFSNANQSNTNVIVPICPGNYQYVWTIDGGQYGCIDKDTLNVTFSNTICLPLSATLLGFKGIAQEKGNLLSWETANENNNKGFYLQRSYDLPEWETLPALIKGKNQTINGYDTLDSDFNRQMNKVYYRLLQEDTDGNITYSDYISLLSIASDNILIYPNPASNTIFIENAMQEILDKILIYNEIGEEVINYENITGSNKISLSIKDLTAGIYFMKIYINNGKSSLHKFVKED